MDCKECLICLEVISEEDRNLYFLPCSHFFHENCIYIWLRKNLYCPLCRIPIFINSVEQMENYKKFTEDQMNDEKARNDNLGMDINSLSYRYMIANRIPNSFGYSNAARINDFYDSLDDVDEKRSDIHARYSILRRRILPVGTINLSNVPQRAREIIRTIMAHRNEYDTDDDMPSNQEQRIDISVREIIREIPIRRNPYNAEEEELQNPIQNPDIGRTTYNQESSNNESSDNESSEEETIIERT